MFSNQRLLGVVALALALALVTLGSTAVWPAGDGDDRTTYRGRPVTVHKAAAQDVSPPLGTLAVVQARAEAIEDGPGLDQPLAAKAGQKVTSASVEQTEQGAKPAPEIVASFDGLGDGFKGPQGTATLRNPSDNSLAVGPDHIVQTVNTKMAIFTKKGKKFDTTGKVLYGPVNTGNVFKDFGDFGNLNGGDAVVRYDQLADRWLIVLPIFRRLPFKNNEPPG